MKDLYILGAGGWGREVLELILRIQRIRGQQWNLVGFLDDTENPLRGKSCDLTVVGTIRDCIPKENDVFVMGIADPAGKEKIAGLLQSRGALFQAIIHPYVRLGRHTHIGKGVVIYDGSGMTVNISVGDFVTLLGCSLGHDVSVGDYATVSGWCNIMGGVRIGRRAFVGGSAAIAPHCVIGDDAYVGVGSVVINDVKSGEKVFGNPAREIGL